MGNNKVALVNGSHGFIGSHLVKFLEKIGCKVVPIIFEGTLAQAVEMVYNGFNSTIAEDEHIAEGLIGVPKVPLFARNGKRIITKIKCSDFVKLRQVDGDMAGIMKILM